MPTLDPQPISFDTTLANITGPVAIEFDDEHGVGVLEVSRRVGAYCNVRLTRAFRVNPVGAPGMLVDRTLGEIINHFVDAKPLRAYLLPVGKVYLGYSAVPSIFRRLGKAQPKSLHFFRVDNQSIPLSHLLERQPAPQDSKDVDAVKEEYGALLSDIIYRIENPALFDVAVPSTRAFTAALMQWDNAGTAVAPAERSTLAARVKVTFAAAKSHAETVGISHIPEHARDDALRAVKALRLAAGTKSDDERRSARAQAIRILDSLALYYLPNPDEARLMLEGRRILALPGRRTPTEEA